MNQIYTKLIRGVAQIGKILKKYFYIQHYLYRLFSIIVILILLGVGLRNWHEYYFLNEEMTHSAYHEAKLLQEYFLSVRYIYHQQFLNSGIELNENTIGFLPAHAASLISDHFIKGTTQGVSVRNISDQNRNPNNVPKQYERDAIEHFKRYSNEKEIFKEISNDGKNFYFYATPLKIEAYCLTCHGKREEAPPFIRENYTTGYDYQIGDIRGITSITVEKNHMLEVMIENYKWRMMASAMIVMVIITLI